jgi:ABC-2 type transport system ATP-binding protein
VAVIDHGRLAACGTPAELREQGGEVTRMSFRPSGPFPDPVLTSLPEVTSVHRQGDTVVVTGTDEVVTDVILALHEAGVRARQVSVEFSSLEQAFLALTADDAAAASPGGAA